MGRFAEPILLPLSTAAMRLRMSYREVYDTALRGHLGDVQRLGSRLYVPADAVTAAVAKQAAERTSTAGGPAEAA